MVAKMKQGERAPKAAIAKAALAKRKLKNDMKNNAAKVEAENRKKGGYGKAVVSIWDEPAGGIEKSPAYRKMLTRCELDKKGKPPAPENRDGAPFKGGYPLSKYPPNVIVDGVRAPWLPDDWAQVIKNTGPGGVYFGWMSPQGKFFYHRYGYPSAVEETIGRKLTIMDGMSGTMRNLRRIVKPGADKEFHQECLTAKERKFIAPVSEFHFGVVSARRATHESGQHDIMVIESHFKQVGIKATWYVDADSLAAYKKMGLEAKVGGKLTPARNMVLDDAKKKNKVAVEVSDDIGKWLYYDCAKQDFRGETDFKKANAALVGTKKHCVSPLAAAQFILAKMRADPDKPHLGGVFPTANAAMTLGSEEYGKKHFILGDFFVAEPASPCRFDNQMTLKEDYDYTCSHIKTHGCVLRCNRMFLQVKHATNVGGAVAVRDDSGAKEKANIAIMQRKWPGVFRSNNRRKGVADTEVVMNWNNYGKVLGEKAKTTTGAADKKAATKVSMKVHKLHVKKLQSKAAKFNEASIIRYTKKLSSQEYINKRCSKLHNKTVGAAMAARNPFTDTSGKVRIYNMGDLAYDVNAGRLEVVKKK